MTSYIVLEAPGGPDKYHSNTKFIADQFSWLALFFPWLWLALHRLWLYAVAVFALQIALASLGEAMQNTVLAMFAPLSISVLVAFEGKNLIINRLLSIGWRMKAAISAVNIQSAEQVYYGLYPAGMKAEAQDERSYSWPASGNNAPAQILDDPIGIFQFEVKGRR